LSTLAINSAPATTSALIATGIISCPAFEAMDLGIVTIGRTPTPEQEAAFEVEGLFVPYLRDPKSGELTHWIAHAHTLLQD